MLKFESLFLSDVSLDAPHIKHLAYVIFQKTPGIFSYIKRLEDAVSEACTAQSSMSAAYRKLSAVLYSSIHENHLFSEAEGESRQLGLQFCEFIDELVESYSALSTSIRSQLLSNLEDYGSFSRKLTSEAEILDRCEKLRDQAFHSYMKLSKKSDTKEIQTHLLELASLRRDCDCAAASYYGNLNRVECLGQIAPILSMTYLLDEHMKHTKRLSELFGGTATGFLDILTSTLRRQLSAESALVVSFSDRVEALRSEALTKFYSEPWILSSGSTNEVIPSEPNQKLHSKSGRLLLRQRVNLVWRWTDVFCSTQNGNLMYQRYEDVGASLLINLNQKGVYTETVDCDDRRNVFQLVSPTEKRTVILQAESQGERDEWICTLTNIIFDVNNLEWNRSTTDTDANISSPAAQRFPPSSIPTATDPDGQWSLASLPCVHLELPTLPQLNALRDAELVQTYQVVGPQSADQDFSAPSGSNLEFTEKVTVESPVIAEPLELGLLGYLELPPVADTPAALHLNDVLSYVLSCRAASTSTESFPCRIIFTKRDVWLLAASADADDTDLKRMDVLLRIPLIRFRSWFVSPDDPTLSCLILQAPLADVPTFISTTGLVCLSFRSDHNPAITEGLLASQLEMIDSLQDDNHETERSILLENISRLSDPPSAENLASLLSDR